MLNLPHFAPSLLWDSLFRATAAALILVNDDENGNDFTHVASSETVIQTMHANYKPTQWKFRKRLGICGRWLIFFEIRLRLFIKFDTFSQIFLNHKYRSSGFRKKCSIMNVDANNFNTKFVVSFSRLHMIYEYITLCTTAILYNVFR